MKSKRHFAKIIDCSAVTRQRRDREETDFVSFWAIFPQCLPGEITSLMANDVMIAVDANGISREAFNGRWGSNCDGFIFENFEISRYGGQIPVITGNAMARASA